MRTRSQLAAVLALLLGAVVPLSAQDNREARIEIFAQFGGSFYTDRTDSIQKPFFDITTGQIVLFPTERTASFKKTGRFFAGLRYYFTANDAVEASYSYSPSDLTQKDVITTPLGTGEFVDTAQVGAYFVSFNYVRYVKSKGRWRAFATGGLGVAHFEGLRSPTKPAGNFGGGIDIPLHRHLALRAEYRLFLMPRPKLDLPFVLPDPGSPGGIVQNHVPSAGIVLRF